MVIDQCQRPQPGFFKVFFGMLSEPERCDNTLINILMLKKSCLCFSHVSLYRSLPDKLEDYFLLYSIDISVIKVADDALELPERVIVKHPAA